MAIRTIFGVKILMIGSISLGLIKIEALLPSEAFCDLRGCCYFDDLPSHTLFQTRGTGFRNHTMQLIV